MKKILFILMAAFITLGSISVYADQVYVVSGSDGNGFAVNGEVITDKSGGTGYVKDSNGNMHKIAVKWTGENQLTGYDASGNFFTLTVTSEITDSPTRGIGIKQPPQGSNK